MTLSSNQAMTFSVGVVLLFLVPVVLFLYGRSRRFRSLREQNEYLATIINSANEGIYVTDRERRFLLWNEAAARIAGYGRDDIVGKLCYENILCHTDGEGRELCFSRCPLQSAIEQGAAGGPEIIYLRHRDGTRVPVSVKTAPIRDSQGDVIGGVEIFEDVTERLEREKLLRERKEKLEAVLDGINDGILFLDPQGIIRGVNRSCFRLLGFSGDIMGKRLGSIDEQEPLHRALSLAEKGWRPVQTTDGPDDSAPDCGGQGSLLRCWTGKHGHDGGGGRAICASCGSYRRGRAFLEQPRELILSGRTLSAVSTFLELQGEGELWEVLLFRDVTAEKLDAALNVAGAAAHELRQPLQVLLMISGMMNRSQPTEEEFRKHIDALVASCNRMDRIIHAMTEITAYRTKDYVDGTTILDIRNSSKSGKA